MKNQRPPNGNPDHNPEPATAVQDPGLLERIRRRTERELLSRTVDLTAGPSKGVMLAAAAVAAGAVAGDPAALADVTAVPADAADAHQYGAVAGSLPDSPDTDLQQGPACRRCHNP